MRAHKGALAVVPVRACISVYSEGLFYLVKVESVERLELLTDEPKTPSFSQTRRCVISTTNLVHKPSSWHKQPPINSSYKSVRQGDYRGRPTYNANAPSNAHAHAQ